MERTQGCHLVNFLHQDFVYYVIIKNLFAEIFSEKAIHFSKTVVKVRPLCFFFNLHKIFKDYLYVDVSK